MITAKVLFFLPSCNVTRREREDVVAELIKLTTEWNRNVSKVETDKPEDAALRKAILASRKEVGAGRYQPQRKRLFRTYEHETYLSQK